MGPGTTLLDLSVGGVGLVLVVVVVVVELVTAADEDTATDNSDDSYITDSGDVSYGCSCPRWL